MEADRLRARTALVGLLKASKEWRAFYKRLCMEGPVALSCQTRQFRMALAERGQVFSKGDPALEDALFDLASELLPDTPAASWSEWGAMIFRNVRDRISEHCVALSFEDVEDLDLSATHEWDERIVEASVKEDRAAFREAAEGYERAALEALGQLRAGEKKRTGAA